jgi:hypothetical protein
VIFFRASTAAWRVKHQAKRFDLSGRQEKVQETTLEIRPTPILFSH